MFLYVFIVQMQSFAVILFSAAGISSGLFLSPGMLRMSFQAHMDILKSLSSLITNVSILETWNSFFRHCTPLLWLWNFCKGGCLQGSYSLLFTNVVYKCIFVTFYINLFIRCHSELKTKQKLGIFLNSYVMKAL